ncbi:MAG TPA: hypothetical protein VKF80_06530 [Candidatus Eisenbacteria bacterium]|nr:hypothetical protein [Candidatus Eisenbacteria bacterium]
MGGATPDTGTARAAHAGITGAAATTAAGLVGAVKRASLTTPSAQGASTPRKQHALSGAFTGEWQDFAWQQA